MTHGAEDDLVRIAPIKLAFLRFDAGPFDVQPNRREAFGFDQLVLPVSRRFHSDGFCGDSDHALD